MKKIIRKPVRVALTLNKETIRVVSATELAEVVGGGRTTTRPTRGFACSFPCHTC